ncbi:GNAT family N-acetyltransferase [Microbacterium sp. SSW1-59]|uniref:GNAT family N-acetyltransferase n=1 Tax=Microbacterium xanthum TaxID=3079794 RepID=UPI002AD31C67|nr:GNAT family N-acetyltransferase [Microbacterium sp. SSW1-59]MDZ8201967.1 GNAT family N-acetyltransferase [Microbacterium sp. SSW1-59]
MSDPYDGIAAVAGARARRVGIPRSVADADAADFLATAEVRNIVYRESSGTDDHTRTPAELLPHYQADRYEIRHLWLLTDAHDRPIGRIGVDIPLESGSTVAFWQIELVRRVWGHGIGSAAYDLVERTAREHGRTVLQSWADHPDAPGERLTPPTGAGSIPFDHVARFYRRHGYTLEQIERCSAYDLTTPTDRLAELFADAERAAAGYRVVHWMLPTPPDRIPGYAWMKSRMSTDVPAAALTVDEEVWDTARVERHDALWVDGGHQVLVTAAEQSATGELCAFNELVRSGTPGSVTFQEDTLVLAEHRGHRLGMLVKCAGLLQWRSLAPDSPRVITYNAEENRPMLDINEALGFAPVMYDGAWKKTLV